MPYSPHDLLPIKNPKDEMPNQTYFYEKVVRHLVPDIIKMEASGIPIDLKKVAELEKAVTDVIEKVHERLKTNPIMLAFLETISSANKRKKVVDLEQKKKTPEEFLKPFDLKNKIHRSYVINEIFKDQPDLQMNEWSLKDMKKVYQVTANFFIGNLISKTITSQLQPYIDSAMKKLAEDKCEAFNKNRVEAKQEKVVNSDLISIFNPASTPQKQKFFEFYGIESENETDAGNPKWDRDELERVQKYLKLLLEEKEHGE